jgi:hypothetical protein
MKAKAKLTEEFVPTALRQVWEWKDSIYQETKHLPTREALREIMRMAHEVAVKEGFVAATPPAAKVAEAPGKYRAKRKQ